jgi:hypothetical protein
MTRPELEQPARSPLWGDLRIVIWGIWGFLRQCLKSWGTSAKGPHELEAGE